MHIDIGDDVLQRRARIVTAALRAAYAWSVHGRDPRAFEEIARMTGVVMFELGPGVGPATPMDLVRYLRKPLGGILPNLPDNGGGRYGIGIDAVALLSDDDTLAEAAVEIGSDYVREVVASRDPGRDWLPSWTWMRSNDIEHDLFGRLVAAGSADDYQLARRFVVEHAAGDEQELASECDRLGAARVARYVPIPAGQSHATDGVRWWWPCPVCGWPMHVDGVLVRCRYRYHKADFQITSRQRGGPRLMPVDPESLATRRGLPERRDARNALQVEQPVWQFVVVPGATELRLWHQLTQFGANVDLYPRFDRYDLDIGVGSQRWDVDVKEHRTVEGLLRHIGDKPPAARYVVLPETHKGQIHAVRAALDNYTVLTETELVTQVKAALRRQKRSTQ